jgi:hypothetical protein
MVFRLAISLASSLSFLHARRVGSRKTAASCRPSAHLLRSLARYLFCARPSTFNARAACRAHALIPLPHGFPALDLPSTDNHNSLRRFPPYLYVLIAAAFASALMRVTRHQHRNQYARTLRSRRLTVDHTPARTAAALRTRNYRRAVAHATASVQPAGRGCRFNMFSASLLILAFDNKTIGSPP